MRETKVAVVFGAGEGLGGAIARRFAGEGFHAVVVRRKAAPLEPLVKRIQDQGGTATAFAVDARKEEEVVSLFDEVERTLGPVEVAVHNIGANVAFSILDFEVRKYYKIWEMACLSGFLMGREAARRMLERERGTIIFTGATASLRGRSGMAGFAGAKAALRALAQSMARELGPRGIHVAHTIIDGAIDMPWTRENFPALFESRPPDGVLAPDDVAEAYWSLHCQPRSAWTHELDLRPFVEPW
ncbi:MAG: SDR family oxidoreductase [Deltaproteobacteria bacterium]|nr:SDR family oxidoreductase [Deltaproteobacteria bacterium]MBW2401012.1 SDR family oxidoreductase [Deltaproteobacteria bacterium]